MMYRRGFLAALLILMLGPVEGCFNSGGGSAPSGGSTGSLRVVTGTCKVTFKTETKVHNTGATAQVPMGAMLETDAAGVAVVNWGKTSQILQPNTKLTYVAESKTPGYGVGKVDLLRGLTSFFLPKSDTPDFKFQASSHSIVAAVKGTAFDMSADGDSGPVVIATTRGTVYAFERQNGEKGAADRPEDAGKALGEVPENAIYATADTTTFAAAGPGSVADGKPVTPVPMKGGVMALFNKPLTTGLNNNAIPADSMTVWGMTVEVLTGKAIVTF